MNKRQKIIDLIRETPKAYNSHKVTVEDIADHLIANNVIVLPCKLGSKIYIVNKTMGCIIEGKFRLDDINQIGTRIFLDQKDAERVLNGGK